MKLKWCCLALAFLFLLPACSRQAKDDAYHWIPPEKQIAESYDTNDVPPYDPASGMTYEEYLCTLEVPVVFSVEHLFGASFLSEESMSTFPNTMTNIRNAPHVIDVSFPVLLHWINPKTEEEETVTNTGRFTTGFSPPSMKNCYLMIGQNNSTLKEEQLSEGRIWKEIDECCVNRALYEKLLADAQEAFTGTGDTVTAVERIYHKGSAHMSDGSQIEVYILSDSTEFSFTVVGVIEDEGQYANAEVYGDYHIYTQIDMVKSFVVKHNFTHPNINDELLYLPRKRSREYANNETILYCRPSPDDPTKTEIRLPGNNVIPEEDLMAKWEGVADNAGYIMEVTLDSGTGYAEFLEYINAIDTVRPARYFYDTQYKLYEMNVENNKRSNIIVQLNMPQILEEIAADGELDEWFYYRPVPRVVRPLRVAP